MIALADQIKFIEDELSTREEAYPVRVQMKRMTQKDANRSLALLAAVLATLLESEKAPVVVNAATTLIDRYAKIEPTLQHIRKCAHGRRGQCHGCQAIDDVLEEAMRQL